MLNNKAMVIDIPNQVMAQMKMTPDQLRLELAVYLYDKKRLTMGQAKTLAGLGQIAFQQELAQRNVFIHYDEGDFQKDLDNLGIKL
jgi:predicted HTH domain antitoxin